jgi:hypothetical protein
MTRKRSTIDVSLVLERANAALAGEYGDAGYRAGIASLLETILHATGNYHGYGCLGWLNGGCDAWRAAGEPGFPEKEKFVGDDSRRVYYS